MDPYLEGSLWTTIHGQLAAEVSRQLAPKLRPRYLALMGEYFVADDPESVAVTAEPLYLDVGVAQAREEPAPESAGAVAVAPLRLETPMPRFVPHFNVQIRDREKRRLVTSIEFLSPTNKRGRGRKKYLAKRGRILSSTAHLMEIDLLRQGQRVPMVRPLPPASYFVFLSRTEERPMTEIWPISLRDALPVVPVPLLPGDADVPLDLQSALNNIYDQVGYDLAVDYGKPPEVPLSEEEAAWAGELLKSR
jgi:hypothetical protein